MVYIASVVLAIIIALLAIQLQRIVTGYRAATGTPWQRFLAAFSHSHTILLARVGTLVSGVSLYAVNFLPALDPASDLGAKVAAILKPEYVVYYSLGFSLLVEIVRRQPSSIDPIVLPPQAVVIPPAPPVEVVPNV